MKKTIISLLLSLLVSVSLAFAGLRDSVLIIEPVLNPETKATYESIASYFDGRGLTEAGDYFRSWAKGGHGSGFALRLDDGRTVLVTNRHVAAYADTVVVKVDTGSGDPRTYADCKVLYTDSLVDIALIAAPVGLDVPVLELGSTEVQDGADVWSAGYPGFMNKPSWQLTKGTVTNRNILVDDVAPKGENNFLQHSASIDPGNSGGPLLTGDVSKPASLRVVGINTLTATQRNNTFFAVPASKLKAVFTRYSQEQKLALDEYKALAQAGTALENFLNADEWDKFAYLQLFSNSTASEATWLELQKSSRTMSTKDRDTWLGAFYYRPVDTLREYASFAAWTKVRGLGDKLVVDMESAHVDGSKYILKAFQGTQVWELIFVKEGSRWMVKSYVKLTKDSSSENIEKVKKEVSGETGIGNLTPAGNSYMLGISLPSMGSAGGTPGYSLATVSSVPIGHGLTMDVSAHLLQNHYTGGELSARNSTGKSAGESLVYGSLNFGLGLNYFLMFYNPEGYIAPFIGGRFITGVNFSAFDADVKYISNVKAFDIGLAPRLGIEISFDRRIAFGIEGSFNFYFAELQGLRSWPIMLYFKNTQVY